MSKIYPWQEKMLIDIESGGFKPGEVVVMMAGRQTGKSYYSNPVALKRLLEDIFSRPVENLILTEGRIHGARYYCVEPEGGNWPEMEAWCFKMYGEASEVWDLNKSEDERFLWPEDGRWFKNNRKFWFRNEQDRTMFILRWR